MAAVVVNHLHFRDAVSEETLTALRDGLQQLVAAGGLGGRALRVDDTHVILILDFRSAEDADRAAREVGGPWMREHIRPLLAGDTQRSVGEVIASASS